MTTSSLALPGYRAETDSQPWGVWDRHEHRWVVEPEWTDRGAWIQLLGLHSLHPWELELRQVHPHTRKASVRCEDCEGDGVCWNCDQQCPTCYGEGVLSE